MSLAKENAELRARLATLEAQVAKLMPKPVVPPPEQNSIKVSQTYWEIWTVCNGRRAPTPIIAASLKRAQEEAAFVARGHLLDYEGHRAPSRPIYELAPDESLDNVAGDGLYITKKTLDGDHMVHF